MIDATHLNLVTVPPDHYPSCSIKYWMAARSARRWANPDRLVAWGVLMGGKR